LAEQIFDSDYLDLFEKICADKRNSPNFVASVLCSSITNLQRRGLDSTLLKSKEIVKSFEMLTEGKISKESIEMIFETIMSGKAKSALDAIQIESIRNLDEAELNKALEVVVQNNLNIIKNQGSRSISTLMGFAMKTVRGKASGEKVNQLLQKKIQKYLDNIK